MKERSCTDKTKHGRVFLSDEISHCISISKYYIFVFMNTLMYGCNAVFVGSVRFRYNLEELSCLILFFLKHKNSNYKNEPMGFLSLLPLGGK